MPSAQGRTARREKFHLHTHHDRHPTPPHQTDQPDFTTHPLTGVDPRVTAMTTTDVVIRDHVDDSWDLYHRVDHLMYDRGDWDT